MNQLPPHRLAEGTARQHVLGLLAYAAPTAILYGAHGDYAQAGTFAAVSGALLACVAAARHLPRGPLFPAATSLLAIVLTRVVLPAGPGSASFFVGFALASLVFSRRNRHAYAAIALGAAAMLCGDGFGGEVRTPAVLGFGLVMAVTMTLSVFFVHVNLASVRTSRACLHATEVALVEERARLRLRERTLRETRSRRRDSNAALRRRLAQARVATERQTRRRADEEALSRAFQHDLREPLRSVVSFGQLLQRRLWRAGYDGAAGRTGDIVAFGRALATELEEGAGHHGGIGAATSNPAG